MDDSRPGGRRRRRRPTSLSVSHGDGDLFGTYRLRQLVMLFWPGVVGFAVLAGWAAWSSIDVNRQVGLPWRSGPLDTLVLPVLVAGCGPVLVWCLTRRRCFVVAHEGVVIVDYLRRRTIAWSEIERFDNALGLVVQTQHRAHPVAALENATLTHLRGRRDRVDDLAEQLNGYLVERRGAAVDAEPLSIDTAEGRSAIRRSAVLVTVLSVGLGLVRLRYHV